MNYSFVIIVANYHSKSNGLMILYRLFDYLTELGYTVSLYIWNINDTYDEMPDRYMSHIIKKIDEICYDSISIIPDAIPFELSKVINTRYRIWYMLNKPNILTDELLEYKSHDIFVSYSKLVNADSFQLFFNNKIESLDYFIEKKLKNEFIKKNQIVVYWGKSRKNYYYRFIILSIICGIKIIPLNRVYPESKETLYKVISESRLLVSFDPLTNLNYESTLCGTPSYIIDNYININLTDYNIPLTGIVTNVTHAIKRYKNGISCDEYKIIVNDYRNSIINHLSNTKNFIKYIDEQINFLSKLSDTEKLERINTILEKDKKYYYKAKKTNNRFNLELSTNMPMFDWMLLIKIFNVALLKKTIEICFIFLRTDLTLIIRLRSILERYKGKLIASYLHRLYK